MKSSLKFSMLALLALLSFSNCDIIKGPKVDPNGFTGSTNKALIEDITGHMCGNCPRAHEQAAVLKGTYGENLVVIAVHAGGFARVVPALGYAYDFNTTMGAEIEAYYHADNTGLPIGMVNRRLWNGNALTRHSDWGTEVGTILAELPKMKMHVVTSYNATTRTVTVDTDLEYYTAGDATHQIVALITEDSIHAQQSDYNQASGHIEDYVHNHVLRGSITPGTWGIPVKGNTIFLGEKISHTFASVLDSAMVPQNCHVVVYVHNNTTKEVLQVEEVKLTE